MAAPPTHDNGRTAFLGGTALGLLRGALYGGLTGLVILAALTMPVSFALPVFLGAIAIGAAGWGIYDAQKGLEEHTNTALKDNARPSQTISSPSPQQNQAIAREADAILERTGSFVTREEERRAATSAKNKQVNSL